MSKAILLIAVVAGTAVWGQAGGGRPVEQQIRQLDAQEVDGLLHNDVTTLGRLWSDDFVVTNPFNKFVNKRQVLGMVKSGTLAFKSYDRQVEYVYVYGTTAIVAGSETVVWAGTLPITGQTSNLRYTSVWIQQGGRWQEVARHANIVH